MSQVGHAITLLIGAGAAVLAGWCQSNWDVGGSTNFPGDALDVAGYRAIQHAVTLSADEKRRHDLVSAQWSEGR